MQLYDGRPADVSGRLEKKIRAKEGNYEQNKRTTQLCRQRA